jgi:prephenate dehydrogenase
MGLTWALLNINPKTHPTYVNSIDTVKRIHTTRILGANPDVYAGIALYNPYVTAHIDEFVRSIDACIEMEIRGDVNGLIRMCEEARQFFGADEVKRGRRMFDEVTSPFFGEEVRDDTGSCLSQTALAYTMKKLGIHPRANIPFQTPPYKSRMLLIYRILDGDIELYAKNATENKETQIHDYYFAKAVHAYAQTIRTRNYDEFLRLFDQSARFFGQEALTEGKKLSDEWIRRLISLQR